MIGERATILDGTTAARMIVHLGKVDRVVLVVVGVLGRRANERAALGGQRGRCARVALQLLVLVVRLVVLVVVLLRLQHQIARIERRTELGIVEVVVNGR